MESFVPNLTAMAEIQAVFEAAMSALRARIADDARRMCPRSEGDASDGSGQHMADAIAVEGENIIAHKDYSLPVEMGHHLVAWGHDTGEFIPPQPFLRPALTAERGAGDFV